MCPEDTGIRRSLVAVARAVSLGGGRCEALVQGLSSKQGKQTGGDSQRKLVLLGGHCHRLGPQEVQGQRRVVLVCFVLKRVICCWENPSETQLNRQAWQDKESPSPRRAGLDKEHP